MKIIISLSFIFLYTTTFSQDTLQQAMKEVKIVQTFNDTRVVNVHSIETLPKGVLELRAGFLFGDVAGTNGGWSSIFGMNSISDVIAAIELGVTDNIMYGISASKGGGLVNQNINSLLKIRLFTQKSGGGMPFGLAFMGLGSISTMDERNDETIFFEKFEHRLSYHASMMVSRKFGNQFSIQANGAWTYRNVIPIGDENDLFTVGGAMRWMITNNFGVVADGTYPISSLKHPDNGFYPAIGAGIEINTQKGDIIQVNVTNARGFIETDYLPYTTSNWFDGEFRIGFTLKKQVSLKKKKKATSDEVPEQ